MVLEHLKKLSPPKALDLLALSSKLATLLLLLSGHKGQSIHALKLNDIEHSDTQLVIRFQSHLSKPSGNPAHEVILPKYSPWTMCSHYLC